MYGHLVEALDAYQEDLDGLGTEVKRYLARTYARELRTRFPPGAAGQPKGTGLAGAAPDPRT
eukprot:12699540-Heterocapsa_arctica.AAC.1